MTYRTNTELPDSVKANLPPAAQDIYRSAFNNAWQGCRSPAARQALQREELARKVAWAAVERRYERVGNGWKPKHQDGWKPKH
ncbi:ChaB family protein [Azospirillum canadense]|uniref:ChaB family protein n=1 Tax=Azospirillum canadense TaxID=403962 RepID=UPI002225C324|nr:ChaB family protein [Azospirillum canadense]MCW2236950.1 cation transport regulator [Azospirillum canadense]